MDLGSVSADILDYLLLYWVCSLRVTTWTLEQLTLTSVDHKQEFCLRGIFTLRPWAHLNQPSEDTTSLWGFLDIFCVVRACSIPEGRSTRTFPSVWECVRACGWVYSGGCLWMWWLPQRRTVFGRTCRTPTWGWRSGSAEWRRGGSYEVCIHLDSKQQMQCVCVCFCVCVLKFIRVWEHPFLVSNMLGM